MIKLQVIGNLGKDCTTNNVNGRTVINFSVAHPQKDSATQRDKPIWVECAYWTEKTGIVPYLRKGTQVFVEGQPDIRTYSKNDGTMGVSLSLRITSVQLLGGGSGRGDAENEKVSELIEANEGSDDLPF